MDSTHYCFALLEISSVRMCVCLPPEGFPAAFVHELNAFG